jgi:TRAP-type uncharacterized transport system fused permease subunit
LPGPQYDDRHNRSPVRSDSTLLVASFLIVVQNFSWQSFVLATGGCILGVTALSAAFSGYLLRPLAPLSRAALVAAALLLVAPELYSTLIGLFILAVVLISQTMALRRAAAGANDL